MLKCHLFIFYHWYISITAQFNLRMSILHNTYYILSILIKRFKSKYKTVLIFFKPVVITRILERAKYNFWKLFVGHLNFFLSYLFWFVQSVYNIFTISTIDELEMEGYIREVEWLKKLLNNSTPCLHF